jgi:hypothetical protein
MTEITRIAIDPSKSVFTLQGVDAAGRAVLRRALRRREVLVFFASLAPVEAIRHARSRPRRRPGSNATRATAGVKRNENDRNERGDSDAEAISVAAAPPSVNSVPVTSAEQQAAAMLLAVRELAVRELAVRELWCGRAPSWSMRCAGMPPKWNGGAARRDGRGRVAERDRCGGRGSGAAPAKQAIALLGREAAFGRHRPGRRRAASAAMVLGATAVIRHAKPGRPADSPGCSPCWTASRASLPPSLWRTKWPASCGP